MGKIDKEHLNAIVLDYILEDTGDPNIDYTSGIEQFDVLCEGLEALGWDVGGYQHGHSPSYTVWLNPIYGERSRIFFHGFNGINSITEESLNIGVIRAFALTLSIPTDIEIEG